MRSEEGQGPSSHVELAPWIGKFLGMTSVEGTMSVYDNPHETNDM